MVLGDRLRDALEQHRLAGARRRDDHAALAAADRRHQVHDAARQVVGPGLELEPLLRIERRQVLEEQLVAGLLRGLEIDRLDLDQREVALPFLRRADLPRHGVAGLQVELADLRRRHVNVVRPRQVVVVGRAQEAEAVRQHLEHPFGEDEAALLGLRLEDLEDQILLAHAGRAGDRQVLRDLRQLLDALVFQIGDVEPLLPLAAAAARLRRAAGCACCCGGGCGVVGLRLAARGGGLFWSARLGLSGGRRLRLRLRRAPFVSDLALGVRDG